MTRKLKSLTPEFARTINIDYNSHAQGQECVSLKFFPLSLFRSLSMAHWRVQEALEEIVDSSWLYERQISQLSGGSIPAGFDCQMFGAGSRLHILDRTLCWDWFCQWEIIMNTLREIWKSWERAVLIVPTTSARFLTSFRSSLACQSVIALVQPKETFTEAVLKAWSDRLFFSMEVTYDCRIYRWIAKIPFSYKNALITAFIVVGD